MPNLKDHQSSQFTKLLLIGDSGSGKTGALTSLVASGYKLRIWDFDNGLDPLVQHVRRTSVDKLGNIEYHTLRDRKKSSPIGPVIDGPPKAFITSLQLFDKWSDGSKPAEWGKDYIAVVDSLTFMGDAAEDWAYTITPSGSKGPDGRMVIYQAQKAVESVIGLVTSEAFRCNVIVTAHIAYIDMPDGSKRGHPVAPGSKLSPSIPRYFNNYALMKSDGGKRTLQTVSDAFIDLKNPSAFKMQPKLPIETGLSDFFNAVRT
jgi:hypothetical protein